MEQVRVRPYRRAIYVLVMVGVLFMAALRGLYFFPTSVALGPCMLDWTSPSTYTGIWNSIASPMRKVRFRTGDVEVQICYGQPAARDRTVFTPDSTRLSQKPVLIPDGRLWRMGANEPTRIFVNGPVLLGDLSLDAGRYSIYTIPGPETWEIFLSRSTFHWGNQITQRVRAREVGSFHAKVFSSSLFQERFRIYGQPRDDNVDRIVVAWADREVYLPIQELVE